MDIQTEIVIIGAGPAGVYFGWQMAKKGFKVDIVEKLAFEKVGSRLDSFHIDSDKFAPFGVKPPQEGDPELITIFPEGINKSPFNNYPKEVKFSFHVMRLQQFMQKFIGTAKDVGVTFHFNTSFSEFIFQESKIAGIRANSIEFEDAFLNIFAKLVVDASGMHTPVRTALPTDYGIENFKISPQEQFYVTLRYVNWKDSSIGPWKRNTGWTFYKSWIAPAPQGTDAIIGVGQPLSYERGEEVFQDFISTIPIPEFDVIRIEKGSTPYRRPPYSVVADGILILGDAACLTKPFSGEGITAGWTLAKIAIDHLAAIVKDTPILTKEVLWPINVNYFHNQGAKFAELLAQIPAAANTTKKEMEYLFKHDVIFSGTDFTAMNRNYEMNLPFGKLLKIIGVLIWGLISNNYSYRNLKSLIGSLGSAGAIRKQYENYPIHPDEFNAWVQKTNQIWAKIPRME